MAKGEPKTIDPKTQAEKMANEAVKDERALVKLEQDFALQSPEFAKFLADQKKLQDNINKMWAGVKQALIDANITDTLENDNFKISLSRVPKFDVTDIEKLPKEYVEMIKSPKMDKIKKHFELYEELPAGVEDASFYRLNKTIKES